MACMQAQIFLGFFDFEGFLRCGVLVLALLHDLFPVCWNFGVGVA
jgi:hypothetical protein